MHGLHVLRLGRFLLSKGRAVSEAAGGCAVLPVPPRPGGEITQLQGSCRKEKTIKEKVTCGVFFFVF